MLVPVHTPKMAHGCSPHSVLLLSLVSISTPLFLLLLLPSLLSLESPVCFSLSSFCLGTKYSSPLHYLHDFVPQSPVSLPMGPSFVS